MGIKPSGTNPIIVPPDNVQNRWGEWEASIDTAGQQAGEVFAETHAIATSANSVAATALSEAREAIDASGAANAELEALLDPENENSELWLLQWQINESDRLALERHQGAIEANAAEIGDVSRRASHAIFLNWDETTVDSDYLTLTRTSSTRVEWTIKPGWAGDFEVDAGVDTKSNKSYSDGVYKRKLHVPNPAATAFNHDGGIGSVRVTINVMPGATRTTSLPIPDQNIGREWQTLQSWTIPQNTEVTASARLTFTNKTRIATYGLRIMVDGWNVTSSSAAAMSPLFGHGPRVHSASMNVRRVNKGSVISLQAKADHSNSLNRHISGATFDVTWVDNTEVAA